MEILDVTLVEFGSLKITLFNVFQILLIFLVSKIIMWILYRVVRRRLDKGKHFSKGKITSVLQVFKYVVYTLALLFAVQSIGLNLNILWTGSAALLVGIGFGLQNTFNNFISGLILLLDGTLEVGDVVEVSGLVGRVIHIGPRTTEITTRESQSVIVPNSKLTEDNVINWSHNAGPSRFKVDVGVAYGSETDLVAKVLLKSVEQYKEVVEKPAPFVRFVEFADSALLFEIHFWTNDPFNAEFLRSDIRFSIDQLFREHGIKIPFPQRDIHVVSALPNMLDEKI